MCRGGVSVEWGCGLCFDIPRSTTNIQIVHLCSDRGAGHDMTPESTAKDEPRDVGMLGKCSTTDVHPSI